MVNLANSFIFCSLCDRTFYPKRKEEGLLTRYRACLGRRPLTLDIRDEGWIFFMGMIAVAAVPVWGPLLAALADPSQQSDGAMQ